MSADFNLLAVLDALLAEGSVAGAARRLRLSPSAMSRALERLRRTTGDPLLVRAGRGLVPTPRAIALREEVPRLVAAVEAVLKPEAALDLAVLERTFTIRTSDGFIESFGAELLSKTAAQAPGLRLNFLQKTDKDSTPLRDGRVDLETGVIEVSLGPEVMTTALFRDRLICAARSGHAVSQTAVDEAAYRNARHVVVSRSGHEDEAVELPFLKSRPARRVTAIVSGFAAALALARETDLIATVPERHTAKLREGMFSFGLPVPARDFTVSMLWHPRMDADPAHRWLRQCFREVCAA
ncbi:MAG: LysR family transcriptional regulator [Caulobacteraceae bacterium]